MVLYYILLPLAWLVFHIGFRVHTVGRENLRKVQTKGCIIAPNTFQPLTRCSSSSAGSGAGGCSFCQKGAV